MVHNKLIETNNHFSEYIHCWPVTAPYFCHILTTVVKYGETRMLQMWNV